MTKENTYILPQQPYHTISTILQTNSPIFDYWILSREKKHTSTDWMLGVILFSLFVFTLVKYFYKKILSQILHSNYNYQISNRLFNERNMPVQRIYFILNLIFTINLGLFIYQALGYYSIQIFDIYGFYLFLIYSGTIILIYSLKYIIYKISGFVFLAEEQFSEYLHNIFIYNKTVGLILFPLIICIPFMAEIFSSILVNTGIAIICIFYIFGIIRQIKISIKINFAIFYIILYFCIVEIIPIFLFYKLFIALI